MRGDYRKFTVEMELRDESYRLWKRGIDGAVCVVESYREKRSVYFAVSNLLPSASLMSEEDKEYHLMLMGVDEGELIHRDFGPFFVNQKGEGSFFRKFGGPPLDCYTHCLFLAVDRESGKTETILSGTMPFYRPADAQAADIQTAASQAEEEDSMKLPGVWREIAEKNAGAERGDVFSKDRDETQAKWQKITETEQLPEPLKDCSFLIERYGHYLIGRRENRFFVGVPGRFLQAEQPCRENKNFVLWQPIRGGEKFFRDLNEMSEKLQREIFGYWIGEIDRQTGRIVPL